MTLFQRARTNIILTDEQPMKDNLKFPCKECPFRKASLKGWLGGISAKKTHDLVLDEANFACHMTRKKSEAQMSRCKGSQLFLIHHCKLPRKNEPLMAALSETKKEVKLMRHNLNDYLGFDFLEHHS